MRFYNGIKVPNFIEKGWSLVSRVVSGIGHRFGNRVVSPFHQICVCASSTPHTGHGLLNPFLHVTFYGEATWAGVEAESEPKMA